MAFAWQEQGNSKATARQQHGNLGILAYGRERAHLIIIFLTITIVSAQASRPHARWRLQATLRRRRACRCLDGLPCSTQRSGGQSTLRHRVATGSSSSLSGTKKRMRSKKPGRRGRARQSIRTVRTVVMLMPRRPAHAWHGPRKPGRRSRARQSIRTVVMSVPRRPVHAWHGPRKPGRRRRARQSRLR